MKRKYLLLGAAGCLLVGAWFILSTPEREQRYQFYTSYSDNISTGVKELKDDINFNKADHPEINWAVKYHVKHVLIPRIIDGDTVDDSKGERYRFLAVDAPETLHGKKSTSKPTKQTLRQMAEKGWSAAETYRRGNLAIKFVSDMILGQKVTMLISDKYSKGRYGRTLVFVFFKNKNVNWELYINGHAGLSRYKNPLYDQNYWRCHGDI